MAATDIDDAPEPAGRPALRTVESTAPRPDASAPGTADNHRPATADERCGPPRLRIHIEETTDEAADRRRLKRIMDLVTGTPGEQLAELAITTRAGETLILRLAGVAEIEALIPELQPVLGVLGSARRIGDEAYEQAYAAAAG